jgi:hypothetical protein
MKVPELSTGPHHTMGLSNMPVPTVRPWGSQTFCHTVWDLSLLSPLGLGFSIFLWSLSCSEVSLVFLSHIDFTNWQAILLLVFPAAWHQCFLLVSYTSGIPILSPWFPLLWSQWLSQTSFHSKWPWWCGPILVSWCLWNSAQILKS